MERQYKKKGRSPWTKPRINPMTYWPLRRENRLGEEMELAEYRTMSWQATEDKPTENRTWRRLGGLTLLALVEGEE